VFRVPVGEVQARFPWTYFGLGMKLRVNGAAYRPWFVASLRNISGRTSEGENLTAEFETGDMASARDITVQWRTALSGHQP